VEYLLVPVPGSRKALRLGRSRAAVLGPAWDQGQDREWEPAHADPSGDQGASLPFSMLDSFSADARTCRALDAPGGIEGGASGLAYVHLNLSLPRRSLRLLPGVSRDDDLDRNRHSRELCAASYGRDTNCPVGVLLLACLVCLTSFLRIRELATSR